MKNIKSNYLFIILLLINAIFFISLAIFAKQLFHSFTWTGEGPLYYSIYQNLNSFKLPYINFFIEYPPLAPFFIGIPAAIIPGLSNGKFIALYILTIGVWISIFLTITYSVLKYFKVSIKRILSYISIILILLTILFNLTYARFDLIPGIFTTTSIFIFIYYLKSENNKYLYFSIALLMIAFSLKIYPIVILPIYIIIELNRKKYKSLIISAGISFLICCLSLIFIIGGFKNFQTFMNYQTKRDIEIESVYSSPLYILEIADKVDNQFAFQNGAIEITNDYAKNIGKVALPLIGLFTICAYFFMSKCFLFKKKMISKNSMINLTILYSVLVTLIFIIFNKVLSPQYILWIVCLLPLIPLISNFRKRDEIIFISLVAMISILTTLVFPIFFWELMQKKDFSLIISIIRNVAIISLMIFIIKLIITETRLIFKKK
ncbi:MAG: hypothetical protein WCJ19_01090 [bacterium]